MRSTNKKQLVTASSLSLLGLLLTCLACSPSTPKPAHPLTDNVVVIPTPQSTAYLLLGSEKAALIDSGSSPAASEIMRALQDRGIKPERVRAIFTTAAHRHLSGGAWAFKRAVTYIGAKDHRVLLADKLPKALLPKLKARLSPRPNVPHAINNVYPGDHIRAHGFELDVIGTPGVSRDSMMYLFNEILFTGEGLLIKDGQFALPGAYQVASEKEVEQSLSRLTDLKFHTVADGHGNIARLGPKDIETFIASL